MPDYSAAAWGVLGFLLAVGLLSQVPVVGYPLAVAIVTLVIVGLIARAFVRAARPRR